MVKEFVYAMGGNRLVSSILISNNGLAAVKFIRSIHAWSHEVFGVDR